MINLSEIARLEAQARKALEDIKKEIVEAVQTAPALPGVTQISKHPAIAIVNFSALKNGWNMAPETYLQSEQAKAIDAKVRGCQSLTAFAAAVREMVETKRVKMPGSSNYGITLNDNTVAVLREVLDLWNEDL